MAQRVLTDEEREDLKNDQSFLENCEWGVRNYADFWSNHDGSGVTSPFATLTKYVKDRLVGVNIVLHDIQDINLRLTILKVSKGISAMLAQNKFAEMASLYFNHRGESIDWTVGGN